MLVRSTSFPSTQPGVYVLFVEECDRDSSLHEGAIWLIMYMMIGGQTGVVLLMMFHSTAPVYNGEYRCVRSSE